MWYIAGAYFCFFYGAYFYVTWFPTYLLEYRHLSLKEVGFWASVPLIAAMIGDVTGGWLTDSLYRRTKRLKILAADRGGAGFAGRGRVPGARRR